MATKVKIWTLSGLVAAAMDNKNGEKSVQIGRGDTKSTLRCVVVFTNDRLDHAITANFEHQTPGMQIRLTPNEAEDTLKRQKALTPKVTKADKKLAKKQAKADLKAGEKAAKKERKAAKKAAKKPNKAKPATDAAPAPVQ